MAENKTKPTDLNAEEFIDGIQESGRKADCKTLAILMEEITGEGPTMWGPSIVGFGNYRYQYASGRAGDWFLVGLSPRKQYLTIYIMGYLQYYDHILKNLGKHKHGKGCLYIKSLEDIDLEVLRHLIRTSIERISKHQNGHP